MNVLISVAAIVISLASLAVSIYFTRRSQKTNVLPLLIFSRDQQRGWLAENVGYGPALNVIVFDGDTEKWHNAVRCYAIPASSRIDLPWAKHPGQLGAIYEDAHGRKYTSVCKHDRTSITHGKAQLTWPEKKIEVERVLRGHGSSSSPLDSSSP